MRLNYLFIFLLILNALSSSIYAQEDESALSIMLDSITVKSFRYKSHIRTGSNNAECQFHNGSVITVVTSNDNARSARAHIILLDRKQSTLNTLNCWNILRAISTTTQLETVNVNV
mgnify:CR=1 FL=1